MAGRAVQRPAPVAVLSVATVSDPATQRAFEATQDATQDAQTQIRALRVAQGLLSGRFLGRQLMTGSGTYAPTAGTARVRVRAIGGGAGGGGAAVGAGRGAGAGGSSGVLLDLVIGNGDPVSGGAYACGAGGAGGTAAGGNGAAGGDTTFVINGVAYTVKGGGGGGGVVGVAGDGNVMPTAPAAGTSTGGVTTYGLGEPGIMLGGTAWFSGDGGATSLGAGGVAVGGDSVGSPGQNYGGGGSGAAAGTVGAVGGAGAPGAYLVEEYS